MKLKFLFTDFTGSFHASCGFHPSSFLLVLRSHFPCALLPAKGKLKGPSPRRFCAFCQVKHIELVSRHRLPILARIFLPLILKTELDKHSEWLSNKHMVRERGNEGSKRGNASHDHPEHYLVPGLTVPLTSMRDHWVSLMAAAVKRQIFWVRG
jgi:hypothetical protein